MSNPVSGPTTGCLRIDLRERVEREFDHVIPLEYRNARIWALLEAWARDLEAAQRELAALIAPRPEPSGECKHHPSPDATGRMFCRFCHVLMENGKPVRRTPSAADVERLEHYAGRLAMLALQSSRYERDSEYREMTDSVLTLTRERAAREKGEPNAEA